MIWAVVSKSEMEGYNIPPVFQYYREVIGKDNIKLAIVDEDDALGFIHKNDVVLLRTASTSLISTILDKGVKTTAENPETYELANDKSEVGKILMLNGIRVPKQYSVSPDNHKGMFFVKPRFGGESFGITAQNICRTWDDIDAVSKKIFSECRQSALVEDYIDGIDCTVACYVDHSRIRTHAIAIECDEVGGVQTYHGKFAYNEYCHALTGKDKDRICELSVKAFKTLGIRHHARFDFRKDVNGEFYLIDVNLIPGLGPSAHFSKCLLLTENISYTDTIKAVIRSASYM